MVAFGDSNPPPLTTSPLVQFAVIVAVTSTESRTETLWNVFTPAEPVGPVAPVAPESPIAPVGPRGPRMSALPFMNENFVWFGGQMPLGLTCTMRSRRLQHTVTLRRVLALAACTAPATANITTSAAALSCLLVIR